MEKASSETRGFVAAMAKLIEHRLDPTEVSLLRAVALFRPGYNSFAPKTLLQQKLFVSTNYEEKPCNFSEKPSLHIVSFIFYFKNNLSA